MKKKILFSVFSIILILVNSSIRRLSPFNTSDSWKKWLNEVDPIITKAERSVFNSLKTEEDRKRFQEIFWKVRDPDPRTVQNEYKEEFYRRLSYANIDLEGANSDRGRIYILLGEPLEKKNFSGYEEVVDCELWIYKAEGRPGLPPFMYILFFRQNNFGIYRQFHPGLDSALDILSPSYMLKPITKYEAFQIIKRSHPELAQATLSIIPGEGDPLFSQSLSSSGSVLAQIYSLPEREIDKSYLKNFEGVEGLVDVTYSTRGIEGSCLLSISSSRGFKFLNYSVMPDIIHVEKVGDDSYGAKISLNLRVEDFEGKTIHQQERELDLRLNEEKKKVMLDERRLVFKDFAPIIEGEFNVSVAFSNKTTEEFFVYTERVVVKDGADLAMVGFKVEEVQSDKFIPYHIENYKILSDPRLVFNKTESIEGIIKSEEMPEIHLISIEEETNRREIKDIIKRGNLYLFKQSLEEVKSGNYYLRIKNKKAEIFNRVISVMPFLVKKPFEIERSEAFSAHYNYTFILGQQCLNKGEFDKAIEYFNRLPEEMWNGSTIPVIAKAYYLKKDYERVVELLEKEGVEKNYAVLLLLGNSSLELGRLKKAAEYFEMLRNYGDTIKINQTLGAIYYSLGDREKARVYWDRAKKLKNGNKE